MTRHRNNIVILRRDWPNQVKLPNGRRFLQDKTMLIKMHFLQIQRTYRRRPAQGRRARVRWRAKLTHQIRVKGLKSFAEKAYHFFKKVAKNSIVRELGKMAVKELPKVYNKDVSKIKIKRPKKLAGSDFANMLVDSGASYVPDKIILLEFFFSNQLFRFINFHKLINEKNVQYPFMIMNTDKDNKRGMHWWSFV